MSVLSTTFLKRKVLHTFSSPFPRKVPSKHRENIHYLEWKSAKCVSCFCGNMAYAIMGVREACGSQMGLKWKRAERTAVIFIHGMFSSATFWFDTDLASSFSDDVRKQHRLLAPDLLGCGRSPRPVDGLYTLVDQIEAIEKSVIQRHKLRSFHLVGHSMGSIVALALAARCPQRVRSISLIAPVYPPCCLRKDGELAQIPCDAFFSFLDPLTVSF